MLTSWLITRGLRDRALPFAYLVRGAVWIMATSLLYFRLWPTSFPHDLAAYASSMLVFGVILIGLLPTFLGLTFFIFDFSLTKKLLIATLISVHFTLFISVQYLLHTWLIHQSVLLMPLLYFGFGPLLEAIMFIAFYGWAMSWRAEAPAGSTQAVSPRPRRDLPTVF
jgi:hypothetical protein